MSKGYIPAEYRMLSEATATGAKLFAELGDEGDLEVEKVYRSDDRRTHVVIGGKDYKMNNEARMLLSFYVL